MKKDMLASVIIPVFNQYDALVKVIKGFQNQVLSPSDFEVIVVDDGSMDELLLTGESFFDEFPGISSCYIRQENKGRAAARNTGIANASSDIVIFCDGDRIPAPDFVEQHLRAHDLGAEVVVGLSYDYFGKKSYLEEPNLEWSLLEKFSRVPPYLEKVRRIYDDVGTTNSEIAWISFLVGNSSVRKKALIDVKCFDEKFVEWGLEHFEIALRMMNNQNVFGFSDAAKNFHIPHPRGSDFYEKKLEKSIELLVQLHPYVNAEKLISVLLDPQEELPRTLFMEEK